MAQCQTIPTSTLYTTDIIPTFTVSTSFSTYITTLTIPVTTSSTTCFVTTTGLDTIPGSPGSTTVVVACASSGVVTFTTDSVTASLTTNGAVETIPTTLTTSTPTSTQFTTVCNTPFDPTTPPPTPPPNSGANTNTNSSTGSSSNSGSSSLTSSGTGSLSPIAPPPMSTTSTQLPPVSDNASNNNSGKTAGIISGAALGSFFGLLGLAGLCWWFWKRKQRWRDIFPDEDDEGAGVAFPVAPARLRRGKSGQPASYELGPTPYRYGHTSSPSGGAMMPLMGRTTSIDLTRGSPRPTTGSSDDMTPPNRMSYASGHVLVDPFAAPYISEPFPPQMRMRTLSHDLGPPHPLSPSAPLSLHQRRPTGDLSLSAFDQKQPYILAAGTTAREAPIAPLPPPTQSSQAPQASASSATTPSPPTSPRSRKRSRVPASPQREVIVHRDAGPALGGQQPPTPADGSPQASPAGENPPDDQPPAYSRS